MTAQPVDVLGVLFQGLTRRDAAAEIARLAGEDAKTYIVKPYSEFMPRAHGDERLRDVLNGAAMRLADGAGILWAASYLSLPGHRLRARLQLPLSLASLVFRPSALQRPLPQAMAGVDFTWEMLKALAESGRSVYLLGGTAKESAGAAQAIGQRLPSLTITGTRDGYFRGPDPEAVIEATNPPPPARRPLARVVPAPAGARTGRRQRAEMRRRDGREAPDGPVRRARALTREGRG